MKALHVHCDSLRHSLLLLTFCAEEKGCKLLSHFLIQGDSKVEGVGQFHPCSYFMIQMKFFIFKIMAVIQAVSMLYDFSGGDMNKCLVAPFRAQ